MPPHASALSTRSPPDAVVFDSADVRVLTRLRWISTLLHAGCRADPPDVGLSLSWCTDGLHAVGSMRSSVVAQIAEGCGLHADASAWATGSAEQRIDIARRVLRHVSTTLLPDGLPPGLFFLLDQMARAGTLPPGGEAALAAAGWRANACLTAVLPERAAAGSAQESLDLLLAYTAFAGDPLDLAALQPLGPLAVLVEGAVARLVGGAA